MPPKKLGKEKEKPAKCGACAKQVADGENGLQCEICEKWFHSKCAEVSDEAYAIICDTDALHWYCKACNVSMEKCIAKIQAKVEKLEEDMKKIKDSTATLKSDLNNQAAHLDKALSGFGDELAKKSQEITRIEEKLEEVMKRQQEERKSTEVQEDKWSDIVNKHVQKEMGSVSKELETVKKTLTETREHAAEEKQKEVRRNNIIIYRAKESTDQSPEMRFKKDKEFCLNLILDKLQVECEESDLKRVIRIGKRQGNEDRPILLEFRCNLIKNRVMESLHKLSDAPDEFRNLSVVHDLTKTERTECKQLVEEAKKKQNDDASGEWLYRVRGNPGQWRIVKVRRH